MGEQGGQFGAQADGENVGLVAPGAGGGLQGDGPDDRHGRLVRAVDQQGANVGQVE